MKLYEDVPLDICAEIDRLSSSLDPDGYEKSMIENDLIPREWNVVILDSSISVIMDEKNDQCNDNGGIYTTVNILKQAFPNENPLTIPIFYEKHKNIHVLCSSYIEEIKTILPVACSITGASFRGTITPKLNYFLHYVNAEQEILDAFRQEIFRVVNEKKMGCFLTLSNLDQEILRKNMGSNESWIKHGNVIVFHEHVEHYKTMLDLYWSYFFDGKLSEYCGILAEGGDLTYELFSSLHESIKTKGEKYQFNNYSDYIHAVKSIELFVEEHKRKENILISLFRENKNSPTFTMVKNYKYLTIDNFYYTFKKAIKDPDHKKFLEKILK
jgi:hypothetical protein